MSPKTCAELAAIVDRSHELGMKFVLKGIMTVEDAIAAERAGCDGIVVSNHGGRALDHTPGTIEVLPAIAAQVKGRMAVLMDGGIRDGLDVLKALAFRRGRRADWPSLLSRRRGGRFRRREADGGSSLQSACAQHGVDRLPVRPRSRAPPRQYGPSRLIHTEFS